MSNTKLVSSLLCLCMTASCALEGPDEDGEEAAQESADAPEIGVSAQALRMTFKNTCEGDWSVNTGVNYVLAGAWRCKKKNGQWKYDVDGFSGACSGDISNCDGDIVCQSTCP